MYQRATIYNMDTTTIIRLISFLDFEEIKIFSNKWTRLFAPAGGWHVYCQRRDRMTRTDPPPPIL